jgi:hypothetical protein
MMALKNKTLKNKLNTRILKYVHWKLQNVFERN